MSADQRDEFKALEQAYMVLKDQYTELAKALGAPAIGFWGDSAWPHAALLKAARQAMTMQASSVAKEESE
ncbi:MAG TPA: hypothetical protein VJW55_14275 [Candidatus Angelobacter sp.]|nr:hypothetical protein [Candidatus Angelobacter sp.]